MECCKCFKTIGRYEYRIFNGLCDSCYYNQYHTKEKEYNIKQRDEVGDYYRNKFDEETK